MKHILAKLLFVLVFSCLFIPLSANADLTGNPVTRIENPLNYDSFAELLEAIINFMMLLAIPIATIMIPIAGIMFLMARGDPQKIEIAKKMLFWIFIGLLILLSAKVIVEFIQWIFGTETIIEGN